MSKVVNKLSVITNIAKEGSQLSFVFRRNPVYNNFDLLRNGGNTFGRKNVTEDSDFIFEKGTFLNIYF